MITRVLPAVRRDGCVAALGQRCVSIEAAQAPPPRPEAPRTALTSPVCCVGCMCVCMSLGCV
ncbi:hypothetical protein E2C01_081001 [Portunus trituberculatus]|uniref:Uncharacterized protein n=1 Tax=Portunus trituberculatus TaxID=210409 RepID=A0A5B7IUN6_PORTR|nr:hypothetical protein [Portunus trituberculatus]